MAKRHEWIRVQRRLALAGTLALLVAACGGATNPIAIDSSKSDEQARDTGPADTGPAATDPGPTEAASDEEPASGSVEDVAQSTVKLITEGGPLEPFTDDDQVIGKIGSGFLIHSDGLVVSTLHSMAQYDTVTAYLFGSDEPISGTVLAASECADIVLIDLDGEGYPVLDWRTEPFSPGLPVFAAGYPLNLDTDPLDVDYTLTAGIVSTAGRVGADAWVAVDGVIEHDARIRGGSSGGPVVDERGDVVGINIAGDDENDLNFAIEAAVAADVVERLAAGDVDSIGIDGEAASDGTVGGVWVSGVRPETPAEALGMQPGDVITSLDGQDLRSDASLQTYCDVLRSAGSPVGLDVEVLRTPTGEVLTGTLGESPLVVDPARTVPVDTGNDQVEVDPDAYEFVADDSGSVGVEVPVAWSERNGVENETFGPSLFAAPDLVGFETTWDVPGLIIELNPDGGIDDLDNVLDDLLNSECTSQGRVDFATDDGAFMGRSETLAECGGTDTRLLNIAATRSDGRTLVRLIIQIVGEADEAIAQRAIDTFDAALPD